MHLLKPFAVVMKDLTEGMPPIIKLSLAHTLILDAGMDATDEERGQICALTARLPILMPSIWDTADSAKKTGVPLEELLHDLFDKGEE